MNPLIEAMVRTDIPSGDTEVDMDAVVAAFNQIKERFIDERTQGFVHSGTGQAQPPVSREEAERRWNACRQQFATMLVQGADDPELGGRLRPNLMKSKPSASIYSDPEAQQAAQPVR